MSTKVDKRQKNVLKCKKPKMKQMDEKRYRSDNIASNSRQRHLTNIASTKTVQSIAYFLMHYLI